MLKEGSELRARQTLTYRLAACVIYDRSSLGSSRLNAPGPETNTARDLLERPPTITERGSYQFAGERLRTLHALHVLSSLPILG